MPSHPSRDELAERYLAQLPFPPYPVQEDALLAYFTTDKGVLVCAPTGTGKTVIAEAALFEALHTGTTAYYTTPLIALTEQKFAEMQDNAVRWGFSPEDVGLVTGNRRVNPQAKVLVVVAEILLNRLLHPQEFDFSAVSAVVMDEFHSFNDPERGIVWEFALALLPKHVRLLLLSATVGNAREFLGWLKNCHGRSIELVQGNERRVPLTYQWVGDELLNEQIEKMAEGGDDARATPALIFCFSRDECWGIAEELKGKPLLDEAHRRRLNEELARHDLSSGAGSKLKQLLLRGVGVHHAGLMPKYRRLVEYLYQRKLLAVCVCTETLAAGINLPARSVVLTTLMKGPPGKKRLIDPSSAHQMFGRAGRPQFDNRGFVFVLAHEDDVKIQRWKEKYDAIPEDTKDPGLLKAKKALKKKRPTRRDTEQYWTEPQFDKLKTAPPVNLASRGPLPWRLLAYLLSLSSEVERIRQLVRKRLLDPKGVEQGERALVRMLITLHQAGYVVLDPPPPVAGSLGEPSTAVPVSDDKPTNGSRSEHATNTLGALIQQSRQSAAEQRLIARLEAQEEKAPVAPDEYAPLLATPTERLARLLVFKSVNPLFGAFLIDHLGMANEDERLQALESVLELSRSIIKQVRVPRYDELPPGPLTVFVDGEMLRRGLSVPPPPFLLERLERQGRDELDEGEWQPPLADKLRSFFDALHGHVEGVETTAVWAAGELLKLSGKFETYIRSRDLVKQEGLIFRHCLRLILLCAEFAELTPPGLEAAAWRAELQSIADRLTDACRAVDPESTDKMIQDMQSTDLVAGETAHESPLHLGIPKDEGLAAAQRIQAQQATFGAGLWDAAKSKE